MLMIKKDSIMRAQSRGDSGFARVLTMLAMLFIAATGAWADDWTNIIVNSDMEGTDVSCFYVHEQAGGMYLARITEGIGVDGSRAIKLQSSDNEANSWDT